MENLKNRMKTDVVKAKRRTKEFFASVELYSKIAWKTVKKTLLGLWLLAIMASCGFTKNQTQKQVDGNKQNPVEQTVKDNGGYDYGYSDPNEVVETPEEKEEREAEEGYWDIMEGKQMLGNAGVDRRNYGQVGEGAPARLTEEEAEALYEAQRKVGYGLDNVELEELDRQVRDNASGKSRDISWAKAVRDSQYHK